MLKKVWQFIDEFLLEPALFGVALVFLLPHIQFVINNSGWSAIKLRDNFMTDLSGAWWVYALFVVLFICWSVSKSLHRRAERQERNNLISILGRVAVVLERLEKLGDVEKTRHEELMTELKKLPKIEDIRNLIQPTSNPPKP